MRSFARTLREPHMSPQLPSVGKSGNLCENRSESRRVPVLTLLLALMASVAPLPAAAQHWIEFVSREERFSVNFPAEPTIRDDIYTTAEGNSAPARIFAAQQGDAHYRVTAVRLPASANNLQAEIDHAAALLRQTGTVRVYDKNLVDGIAAHELSLTQGGGRQLIATILAYDGRLYIAEGNARAEAPPAIHFTQSIGLVDSNGNSVNIAE